MFQQKHYTEGSQNVALEVGNKILAKYIGIQMEIILASL